MLIPFTPPENATTIAQMETMRREIAYETQVQAEISKKLSAFRKKNPELSYDDAKDALRLQINEAAAAKSAAAAAKSAAAAAKSATASKPPKKGGSKTCKRKRKHKHRK